LQNCKLSEAEMAEADVLIRPLFEPAEVRSFKQRNEAIEAGYLAAKAALPEIFKRLNRASAQAVSELH
jgi:NTE family protein